MNCGALFGIVPCLMASGGSNKHSSNHRPPRFSNQRVPGSTRVSKSGGLEYVNIGTPEETLLETYFVTLSKFNFDRAREQCDRERENKGSGGGTNWCEFMSVLSRLATAESVYFNLGYMERSGALGRFVRREPLKATYEVLIQDLKKVHEVYYHGRGGTDFSWERKMTELVTNVIEFMAAKRDMTEFYSNFDATVTCHYDYNRLEKYLKDMSERYKDSFQHTFLKPTRTTFMREVGALLDIIHAQQYTSEWQFLQAILAIQSSDNKLQLWNGVVPLKGHGYTDSPQPQRSIRSGPASPPATATVPYLYRWICKFHVAVLAKFTLYFHQVLAEHASVYDMKHLAAKLDVDYVTELFGMVRQTPAVCAALFFNSNGLKDFKGPKYHFPDSPAPSLTGINSYPLMVAVPYEFEFYHHRANIVSLIMEKSHQLETSAQLVTQYDENLQCTYYMSSVEPRVTLVVISSTRRRDKDTKIITSLSDIASRMRNCHIAALLKPS